MKRNARNFARGHLWAVVIAVIIAMGYGVLIGFLATRDTTKRPSTQSVVDFLSHPLPVPDSATQVKVFEAVDRYAGGGTVFWEKSVVLDVTGMKPNEIQNILFNYALYFREPFLFSSVSMGSSLDLHLNQSESDFQLVSGGDWTWHMRGEFRGDNCGLDIDVQVMDFKPDAPDSLTWLHRGRWPVNKLNDPVQG